VGVFFLFATDLATKKGVTDDWYTDGRVPSVMPSVIISPTDFIVVTDGISPSVKLVNGVVFTVDITEGYICRYCTESSEIFTAHATSTDGQSVNDLPLEIQTE
jgi:hypothetical protein